MVIEVSSEQSNSVLYVCIRSATTVAVAAAAAAAAAALCVALLPLLLQKQQCCCFLLLFVIVCLMAMFVAGTLNLIPVFSFSIKRDFFLMCSLAVLSHLRLRFAYVLGNYRHAQSQGGRQPAAAKPPLSIMYDIYLP